MKYEFQNVNDLYAKNVILSAKFVRTIISLIQELKFQFNFVIWDFLFIIDIKIIMKKLIWVKRSSFLDERSA